MATDRFLAVANEWLSGLSFGQLVAISILSLVLIDGADYLFGADISLAVLYLFPIGIATWYIGRDAGIALALASAVSSHGEEFMTGIATMQPWLTAWNGVLHFGFMLAVVVLLSNLQKHLRIEQELAKKDALTGVLNRRAFVESLQYILDLAARDHWPVTLTYVDVDDFKRINDQQGHAEGDRVLCLIASRLSHSVRHTDMVARLGGDEFALILPHTDRQTAEHIVDKLRRSLQQAAVEEGLPVTCSIGCVTFLAPIAAQNAVAEADQLMYQAKQQGKNRVAFAERGVRWPGISPHSAPIDLNH